MLLIRQSANRIPRSSSHQHHQAEEDEDEAEALLSLYDTTHIVACEIVLLILLASIFREIRAGTDQEST